MSRTKQIVLALAVAALVVILGRALSGGLSLLSFDPGSTEPDFAESFSVEPVPDFGPTPSLDERRTFWMSMFRTGDADDTGWALRQIRDDGDESRAKVIAAAQRSMDGNPALVQQALDLCMDDPRPSDRPFALAALESRSEQTNLRAAMLLGLLGKEGAGSERRLARLAVDRSLHVPRHAFTALSRIGTPAAVEATIDVVPELEPAYRGWAYIALGEIGDPAALIYLRERFEQTEELDEKAALAEALVNAGDGLPLPWLRAQVDRLGDGSGAGETLLRVLANAADPAVRGVLTRRATDPLEDEDRREEAVVRLRGYPIGDVDDALRFAARRHPRGGETENPRKVRVAALESRVVMGSPGAEDDLRALLFAPGEGGRDDREVASLVVGRLRRPDLAADVARGFATLAPDDERLRGWYLRALILCGDPQYAETVVRAMAADHDGFGKGGLSFNVYTGFEGANGAMRAALGQAAVAALREEYGEVAGLGLQHLILAAGWAGDHSAAAAVEPYVLHPVREIRDAALQVLPFVGRRDSMHVLKRLWRRKIDAGQRDALRHTMRLVHNLAE